METDPAIERIREVRRRISAELGHDPTRLIEHYKQMQQEFAGRLVRAPAQHLESQAATGSPANDCP